MFALFLPFIQSYTVGVEDVEYVRTAEIMICSLVGAVWTLRNMQTLALTAAGKYVEMRQGFIFETVATILLCTAGYLVLGLAGLLAGRFFVSSWRFFDLSITTYKELIKYPLRNIAIRIGISAAAIVAFNLIFDCVTRQIVFNSLWIWIAVAAASLPVAALVAILLYLPLDGKRWISSARSFLYKRGNRLG